MYEGHCLCGAVTYRYDGPLGPITLCHCDMCQRGRGSAFSATAPIQGVHIRWQGQANVTEYESSPGRFRAFCSQCGTPIYHRVDAIAGLLRLSISTLSGPHTLKVDHETYVAHEATWFAPLSEVPAPRYAGSRRNSQPSSDV